MSRYIDADKLKDDLVELMTTKGVSAVLVYGLIENQPTADVQEVKHGHWTAIDKHGKEHDDTVFCSACGAEENYSITQRVLLSCIKYCWHCGAKMDEEVEEEPDLEKEIIKAEYHYEEELGK